MAHLLSSTLSASSLCPRSAGLTATPRVTRTNFARAAMADDQPLKAKVGQDPGASFWPPKPITEHGQPKPEDDPNPNVDAGAGKAKKGEATAGPPEDLDKKQTSGLKGGSGTQQGGGGEGSAS